MIAVTEVMPDHLFHITFFVLLDLCWMTKRQAYESTPSKIY